MYICSFPGTSIQIECSEVFGILIVIDIVLHVYLWYSI